MKFTEYCEVQECINEEMLITEAELLDEGLFGLIGNMAKGVGTILGASAVSMIKSMKPTVIKIKDFKKYLNPAYTYEISPKAYQNLTTLLVDNLLTWKKQSNNKGFVDKFVMSKKEIFVKDRYTGLLVAGAMGGEAQKADIDDMFVNFNLSDNYLINDIIIYRMTNGGNVVLMTIYDPYEGDNNLVQVNPKKPQAIEGADLKNLSFYAGVDAKADAWFVAKTGMGYKQFQLQAANLSANKLTKMIDAQHKLYDTEYSSDFYTKTVTTGKMAKMEAAFVDKMGKSISSTNAMKNKNGKVYKTTDGNSIAFYTMEGQGRIVASAGMYEFILSHGLDKSTGWTEIENAKTKITGGAPAPAKKKAAPKPKAKPKAAPKPKAKPKAAPKPKAKPKAAPKKKTPAPQQQTFI